MRFTGLVLISLLAAALVFLPGVSSQEISKGEPVKPEIPVSIHAKGRGFPHVNFEDGRDLSAGNVAEKNSAPSKLMASADFDSDGTADLVTADTGGRMKFYRGNIDSIFPAGEEADERRANGTFTESPFLVGVQSFTLPISPDFLESGDLNADGHADILAAARGGDRLYVAAGNGAGGFLHTTEFALGGTITDLVTGEIGMRDGQTDVAISLQTGKGAVLAVFEHPAGAFTNKPEFIKLPAAANDLAIGNLDTDYFGDIAVASGHKLTVIRGRGHAHPWDSLEGYDIQRPAPIVETRSMPFEISALVAGYFTEKRGESLAILTTAGTIQTLDAPPAKNRSAKLDRRFLKSGDTSLPTKAASKRLADFATFSETAPAGPGEPLRPNLFKIENGVPVALDPKTKLELTEQEKATLRSGTTNIDPHAKERAKNNFLRAISPKKTAPLVNWHLQTIAQDARLINTANLVKVRVSDSGRDELAFVDAASNQLHLMIRENPKRTRDARANEVVSFDVDSAPVAILQMRLNPDALSDLVVLRADSAEPSVMMTAPATTFVVTTASDEDNGACEASCSLREAIDAANNSTGADTITFNIGGGGTRTIQPEFDGLPQIEFAVTINGTTQPGYSNRPLIEIKGNLADEGSNGLRINAANCTIRGLAANEFHQLRPDPEEPGIGGYGITIYNFEGETFSGFSIFEANFLGTDPTGTLDRGNEAGGLYIFDSDGNRAGGTTASARNVMSGNGNGELENGDKFASGLQVVAGNTNLIIGNYFGLTANGNLALGNSAGLSVGGANNTIGGDSAGAGNVASGNRHNRPVIVPTNQGWCGGVGIDDESIVNVTTGEWQSELNIYKGNRVGTNAAGTVAVGNCSTGFFTSPRNTAFVGSVTPSGRNIVSGNTNGGLMCSIFQPLDFAPFENVTAYSSLTAANPNGDEDPPVPEGFCKIKGNNVGADITGNAAIPNNHDSIVLADGVGGMLFLNVWAGLGVYNTLTLSDIGGTTGTSSSACTGDCNLVSGNQGITPSAFFTNIPGIMRAGRDGEVVIFKNYVGTNVNGTSALPNNDGVRLWVPGSTRVGDVLNSDTNPTSLGNLISGNSTTINPFAGFGISGGASDGPLVLHIIRGNLIGTDRTGVNAIPNSADGISLSGDRGVALVGGTNPVARNIVSGNGGSGIVFGNMLSTPTANNYVGVNINGDPLGNAIDGIVLRGEFDYIGDSGAGNVIANNGRNGISVFYSGGSFPRGNRIRFNSIYNNGALGIDLSADTTNPVEPDGVTENDCGDADGGPHRLQNYPILTTPVFNQNGTVTVGGAFGSEFNKTYTLDFYSNESGDSSNYGEGQTWLGSHSVTTDGDGKAAFLVTSTVSVPPGSRITATASDIDGNTSEFSCVAGQCSVSGNTVEEQTASAMKALGGGCSLGFVVNINTDQPDPNPADGICDVDLGTTGPQCSLRAALQTTNAISGTDFISFDIPGGGIQAISPASFLPDITEKVFINATTQPGYSDTPMIQIDGAAIPGADGLVFAAGSSGSNLSAIAINRFITGIVLQSDDNTIEKSFLGMDADGITIPPNGSERQLYGIKITGKNNTIGAPRDNDRGIGNNYLYGNAGAGVSIVGANATGNKVIGSNFGLPFVEPAEPEPDPEQVAVANIEIEDGASNNTIGGTTREETNLITTAVTGVSIESGSNNNFVTRNLVTQCLTGVFIGEASANTIGGTISTGTRNYIVDNEYGIHVGFDTNGGSGLKRAEGARARFKPDSHLSRTAPKLGATTTSDNKIYGNVIGLTEALVFAGNDYGIVVADAENTMIGTGVFGEHNFIGNSVLDGIHLTDQATGTKVLGNFIGTDITGQSIAANHNGVFIAGSNNEVRSNIMSGNNNDGIVVDTDFEGDPTPTGNLITANRIGTNGAGTNAIPNGGNGISLSGSMNSVTSNVMSGNEGVGIGVRGDSNSLLNNKVGIDETGMFAIPNIVGGIRVSGTGNIVRSNQVSGNRDGISLLPNPDNGNLATGNTIDDNKVGVNADMTAAIPNQTVGIGLLQASTNSITGNVVAGNLVSGILLQQSSNNNVVRRNFVGVTPAGLALPNGGRGIGITSDCSGNQIGGNTRILSKPNRKSKNAGEESFGNTVAFNGGVGIEIASDAGQGNVVASNSVFSNSGLGIDIGGSGFTANDPGDADTGPNNLQNYPVIVSKQVVNDELVIEFKVDSAPENSAYGSGGIYVEFFKSDASGEGEIFLGSTFYTLADYGSGSPGTKTVNLGTLASLGIAAADPVTATATDADGNTSEFFPPFAPTAASVSVSGRVTANSRPLKNVTVALTSPDGNTRNVRTNTFGYFNFREVEAGQTYILSARAKGYNFAPVLVNVNDNVSNLELQAT